eukprot:gene5785-11379_t
MSNPVRDARWKAYVGGRVSVEGKGKGVLPRGTLHEMQPMPPTHRSLALSTFTTNVSQWTKLPSWIGLARIEKNRQRGLTNNHRGGRANRQQRQQRQGRDEQVHNNAAFDIEDNGGNGVNEEVAVYMNDAYGNVPQSRLNRDQANRVVGSADAGAGVSGAPDAGVYLEADSNQPAMYDDAANNVQSNGNSSVYATYAGGSNDADYDMPQEAYAALEAGKATYSSSA